MLSLLLNCSSMFSCSIADAAMVLWLECLSSNRLAPVRFPLEPPPLFLMFLALMGIFDIHMGNLRLKYTCLII